MGKSLWNDETGMIVSAELTLILTICVIGVVVGLTETAVAVNTELNDISNAVGSLNQSFFYAGMTSRDHYHGKLKSFFAGSRFHDRIDDCDTNTSCDLVCGPVRYTTGG